MARASKAKNSTVKRPAKSLTKKSGGNVAPTKRAQISNAKKKPAKRKAVAKAKKPVTPQARIETTPEHKPNMRARLAALEAVTGKAIDAGLPAKAIATSSRKSKDLPLAEPVVVKCDEEDVVKFGKHQGKKWADVPIDYLRWMSINGITGVGLARAEIAKREAADRMPKTRMTITPAAIDEASLKLREYWDAKRGTWEGLHSWLHKLAIKAFQSVPMMRAIEADNPVEFEGILFDFSATISEDGRGPIISLDLIRNPKAGIPWKPSIVKGIAKADHADRQKVTGRGVW